MIEKIDAAIAAHSAWKGRLRDAINTGKSEFDPNKVAMDDQCEFGKFLHTLTGEESKNKHFQEVKQHHSTFHKAAAKVLKLALAGNQEEAEKEISLGSEFSQASSQCIMSLSAWKKEL